MASVLQIAKFVSTLPHDETNFAIRTLARHGYKLSPGTLYPMLHGMEEKGYLRSREKRSGSRVRRLYRATAEGRAALEVAKEKLRELVGEVIEGR